MRINHNGNTAINIESLQALAKNIGLNQAGEMSSQKMLIREIQKQRGKEPCYLTDKRYACTDDCEWRANCQKLKAVWLR